MKPTVLPLPIFFTSIGVIHSSRTTRMDDTWNQETTFIELDSMQFTPDALLGLAEFSHIEVIYFLHQVPASEVETAVRHPRGRQDLPKVGIFAQRAAARPNRLGLSCCRIKSINGLTIEVEDLDAIEGTPVLDIKPYFLEFGPHGSIKEPSWVHTLMSDYWK